MKQIAILGAGGFGTALAHMFSKKMERVVLWSAVPSELEDIRQHGENTTLLPGISLYLNTISLSSRLEEIEGIPLVVFAVASPWVRSVAEAAAPFIGKSALVVNVAKGFEQHSLKRFSQVLKEELDAPAIVALSGPSHAEEIAREVPTTIVAASECLEAAEKVQQIFSTPYFRVYVNEDVLGVEYGGALKNIIALCAGVSDGLGLGDNSKAALMTRGITEIARLGIAAGAQRETFAGLSGVGDLIVTCTSMHSRNRRAGILIGKGTPASKAIEEIGMTVEGYTATSAGMQLARRYDVSMPITAQLYQVLYDQADPRQAIQNLMSRPARREAEFLMIP